MTKSSKSSNTTVTLAIGLVLVVVGASMYNLLPLLTEAAADKLGFSARQAGVMSSAITVASGVSSLLSVTWVRSFRWPVIAAISLSGMLVGNALAMVLHAYWPLILVEGIAGFFAGATLALGITIISDRQESARIFGLGLSAQIAYQMIALWSSPFLLEAANFNGVMAIFLGSAGIAIVLVPLLPDRGRDLPGHGGVKSLLKPATTIAFFANFLYFMNVGAYWTYLELMGEAQGMPARVVANYTTIVVLCGIPAGLLASLLGSKFGNLRPIAITALLPLVAAFLLRDSFGPLDFVIAGALSYFAWNCSLAYQLAFINELDTTGRAVAMSGAYAFFGSAAGAVVAAFLLTPGSYHSIVWLAPIAVWLSVATFVVSGIVNKLHPARERTH